MRVLLADDHPEVVSALRLVLEQEPCLSVVGVVSEAVDLVPRVRDTAPDVVLLDWDLPGLRPRRALAAMRNHNPDLAVVALSGRLESRKMALEAGASAFVSKGDPPERLLSTVRAFGLAEES